jgi:hypothetical protein
MGPSSVGPWAEQSELLSLRRLGTTMRPRPRQRIITIIRRRPRTITTMFLRAGSARPDRLRKAAADLRLTRTWVPGATKQFDADELVRPKDCGWLVFVILQPLWPELLES